MYYALSDSFAGDLPHEYTSGFANTKCVIAFETRAARQKWLATTRLLTAKALTRAEAIRDACTATGMEPGCSYGDKIARMADSDDSYTVLRRSRREC